MADAGLSRLTRLLPWTKGRLAPNGVAVGNGDESKGIDFIANLDAGRVVRLDSSIPGDVETVSRATAYAAAAYLYVAIRYRAEAVAAPALRVARKTDDGEEFVAHALDALLIEPSLDFDMGELVELTQTYWDIYGDVLWTKDANLAGSTGRLQPWRGSEYEIKATADRNLGRFDVRTSRGTKSFPPERVVYQRYSNPADYQRGLSPTDVALAALNLGQRTAATIRNVLANAMFPSVVISTHPEWNPTDAQFQRFRDLIDQFHAGPANAGKPFVNLGGGKVERVTFSLAELVPEKLLDRVEATVGAVFRIPPVVLGYLVGLENSPWSQMEQAHRQAYSDAIEPLWRRWEKALTRQLLRPADPDPALRVVFDTSKVTALAENVSAKITDAGAARHWTLNERRAYTGQAPLPDGDPRGDFIELTDAVQVNPFGPPPPAPTPPADDDDKALGGRLYRWSRFDLMAKAQEAVWEASVLAGFKVDAAEVLKVVDTPTFADAWGRAADSEPKHQAKAPPTGDPKVIEALVIMLGKALAPARWRERVTPLVESTGRTALKELADDLGIAFDVIEPTLVGYTQAEAAWLVAGIDATTRAKLADEIAAGLNSGETISGLRSRIEQSSAFSRARAELVARTETTRVTNGAQRQALEDYQSETEEVVEKSWLSARDVRVRDEHAELDDGSWLAVDKSFGNGLQAPGEPNCRCTLLYRILEG